MSRVLPWLIVATLLAAQPFAALSSQERPRVKIGPEHVEPGELRYPARSSFGGTGLVVEFHTTPVAQASSEGKSAPAIEGLLGNLGKQAALDRAARPGDFVTPPAVSGR